MQIPIKPETNPWYAMIWKGQKNLRIGVLADMVRIVYIIHLNSIATWSTHDVQINHRSGNV